MAADSAGLEAAGFWAEALPAEETVVNNYYDSPQDTGATGRDDYAADNSGTGNDVQNIDDASQDDAGQYDDSGQYEDASNLDTGDSGGFDDNSGGDSFV